VPQGAEICAVREGLAAQQGTPKKAWSEACAKMHKRDELYRRALVALAAHGETLASIAEESDHAGELEAARLGVSGPTWIEVEEGPDKAAREAVAQLADQMSKASGEPDLAQAITDAAPHVKTLCEHLGSYLEEQATGLDELTVEIENKRDAPTERRCGMLDQSRSLCVSETVADRVIYAQALGQLTLSAANHAAAQRDVAAFCSAHEELEKAATAGTLDDDATYAAIVEAVKRARQARAAAEPASEEGAAAEEPAKPAATPPAEQPSAATP
jgi:hypothetical protein